MARPEQTVRGRARLARDSQQWMLDYLIQETGRVFHFQGEGRGRLPRSVHSHDMISKYVGLQARRIEALAQAEAAADHPEREIPPSPLSVPLPRSRINATTSQQNTKKCCPWAQRKCFLTG